MEGLRCGCQGWWKDGGVARGTKLLRTASRAGFQGWQQSLWQGWWQGRLTRSGNRWAGRLHNLLAVTAAVLAARWSLPVASLQPDFLLFCLATHLSREAVLPAAATHLGRKREGGGPSSQIPCTVIQSFVPWGVACVWGSCHEQ